MKAGLFITATDTGAGKTTLACALIKALEAKQFNLCIRKPVESGCRRIEGTLHPSDADALSAASRGKPPLDAVCPYRLEHAASPAHAAQLENVTLSLTALAEACRARTGEYLLVEGAGGFYSPIAEDGLNADLAQRLRLPLLLTVADRLGCIGHTLLALEAAHRRNLEVAAIAVNQNEKKRGDEDTDNAAELAGLTAVPIIQTGFGEIDAHAIDKIVSLVA